jgi:hypothetical protein
MPTTEASKAVRWPVAILETRRYRYAYPEVTSR